MNRYFTNVTLILYRLYFLVCVLEENGTAALNEHNFCSTAHFNLLELFFKFFSSCNIIPPFTTRYYHIQVLYLRNFKQNLTMKKILANILTQIEKPQNKGKYITQITSNFHSANVNVVHKSLQDISNSIEMIYQFRKEYDFYAKKSKFYSFYTVFIQSFLVNKLLLKPPNYEAIVYKKGGTNRIPNFPVALPGLIKDKWKNKELQPNTILQNIFAKSAVVDKKNKPIKFTSGVSPIEGWYLYQTVLINIDINTIVEVGMAYGTSALYICQALKNKNSAGKLISIDPNQSTQWQSIGLLNLKRAELSGYHELMEMGSEIAMPQILKSTKKVDMVFFDGMHLFDYTLIDIFFACKILRIHGVLIVDDIRHRGVSEVINYIRKNYPFLEFIHMNVASATMATFIKVSEDDRTWNFHVEF
jgi:predicted O-methyltransferase YrrM